MYPVFINSREEPAMSIRRQFVFAYLYYFSE